MNDSIAFVRPAAIDNLAKYFHYDSQSLPLLRDRAMNDDSFFVRYGALKNPGEYFRDKEFRASQCFFAGDFV